MALVKCSECGNQVSTTAPACPKCGAPIVSQGIGIPLATIQQTSNQLKVENDVWKGNPSYLYYFGHFLAGVLFLPLFGFGLLFILYALLDRNTKVYTLTNKRVISKAGIISRQINEVGTKDIRNINVKQGILGRMFSIGAVEIASAGTAGIEISFVGIKDPMRARDLIRREKDAADSRD
jgi:uncharacterized membrane protein YdbT with pleckstrin-like domain